MNTLNNKLFLYSGLSLLFIALILRWSGIPATIWIPAFVVAILLKIIFLVNVFRTKGFKMSLWLMLIITGVAMILVSLIFKYVLPIPLLRNILFYGAITLKVSGLIIMLAGKIKTDKNEYKSS